MKKLNTTNLLYVLDTIMPLIELGGTGIFASNSLWSIVLGVLPPEEGERQNQIMELNWKNSTKDKVEGIRRLTDLAESITKKHDYKDENLKDFTYAIRQLMRYSWGDEIATASLMKLRDMYITFMTEYFYQSMKFGKKEGAINNLKLFGEEILREDKDLRERLADVVSYKPLN